eukprot:TRINITY_DN14788_c0_g1_i1.p1 TRINITY_DN14788_c0_g1~~TRINITY_DN14788_c0_g1_i1.p1  ORF type:complete len:485 (+),score=36.86 TRINITY_DN14788_c0_g1_i1:40-1455(+)
MAKPPRPAGPNWRVDGGYSSRAPRCVRGAWREELKDVATQPRACSLPSTARSRASEQASAVRSRQMPASARAGSAGAVLGSDYCMSQKCDEPSSLSARSRSHTLTGSLSSIRSHMRESSSERGCCTLYTLTHSAESKSNILEVASARSGSGNVTGCPPTFQKDEYSFDCPIIQERTGASTFSIPAQTGDLSGNEAEEPLEVPEGGPEKTCRIKSRFSQNFSWGREFGRFVGKGYIPSMLAEQLYSLDLIEQLFVIRREMKARIRYESGRETVRRPAKKRGLNKPVTYASNIWNRGYANCAGHCIVLASVLQAMNVPYCIVTVRSQVEGKPKHAIMEVGFPETTITKDVSQRATELWAEYYGKATTIKRDPETNESKRVKLFTGLKFVHSPPGSEAAKRKGVGHWLIMDPVTKVGSYRHLIENGYMTQNGKSFRFALQPEIKTWQEVMADGQDDSSEHGDGDDCSQVSGGYA